MRVSIGEVLKATSIALAISSILTGVVFFGLLGVSLGMGPTDISVAFGVTIMISVGSTLLFCLAFTSRPQKRIARAKMVESVAR
jgi:hypothetical protein